MHHHGQFPVEPRTIVVPTAVSTVIERTVHTRVCGSVRTVGGVDDRGIPTDVDPRRVVRLRARAHEFPRSHREPSVGGVDDRPRPRSDTTIAPSVPSARLREIQQCSRTLSAERSSHRRRQITEDHGGGQSSVSYPYPRRSRTGFDRPLSVSVIRRRCRNRTRDGRPRS